ncbi:MAG: SpoIID/LytB domain-containing protein [Clostridiales bacterium]|nr:SpoIID/LytB domain-containing protein [Clostridiales bacterium]
MQKKMNVVLFFIAVVFFFFAPIRAEAANDSQILKIGLYYGTTALPSANLANEVGSGYDVGYYDSNRNFIKIYSISDEKITVMKDKTIYLAGDGLYYDVVPATQTGKIGAYHLQTETTFSSDADVINTTNKIKSCGYAAFPAYVDGSYVVRIGSYTSTLEAMSAMSAVSAATGLSLRTVGLSETCYTVTATKTTNILFEFDNNMPFGISPKADGKSETWFKGYKYYGGFEYNRLLGNDINVVNIVKLGDYIKGVIPYEMNPSWPKEALKAQALCAKSYALTISGKHRSSGFDLCATDDCQVYRGCTLATSNSNSAVDEVSGLAVLYNGSPAQTYFHSSDGGSTEDAKNVWGGDIPYLKAVPDDFEDLTKATNGKWSKTITPAQVTTILQSKGYDIANVVSLYVDQFTDAGNVYRLSVKDSNGKVLNFEREKARLILNSSSVGTFVYSMRFTVTSGSSSSGSVSDFYASDKQINGQTKQYAIGSDGSVKLTGNILANSSMITGNGIQKPDQQLQTATTADSFTISGRGWGHNIGLSQWGARGMAEQDWTYDKILKYYYTGITISNY